MQDSENKNPEAPSPESPVPSPEPTQPPLDETLPPPQAGNPFIPKMGARELRATWDMLVRFGRAIRENDHWSGKNVDAVAMGLMMITQMAGQYKVQVDVAELEAKAQAQKIKDQIKAQGGKINGEPNGANGATGTPSVPLAQA